MDFRRRFPYDFLLEILLIVRNVLIINANWNSKMTIETNRCMFRKHFEAIVLFSEIIIVLLQAYLLIL